MNKYQDFCNEWYDEAIETICKVFEYSPDLYDFFGQEIEEEIKNYNDGEYFIGFKDGNILKCFLSNENINLNVIEYFIKVEKSKEIISKLYVNPNITENFVKKYYNKNWDISYLFKNPNISFEFIKYFFNSSYKKNWDSISENPNITWDIVKTHPRGKWNYKKLSCNPYITWDIVKEDLSSSNPKPWDFSYLSKNPNITWDIVKEDLSSSNPKPWNFFYLSQNPNITWKIIKEELDSSNPIWNRSFTIPEAEIFLETDKVFSLDDYSSNPDFWRYYAFSKNPNITWDIIEKNSDKPWNYDSLSSNPNINWDIVNENSDKSWNMYKLLQNPMKKWKEEYIGNL